MKKTITLPYAVLIITVGLLAILFTPEAVYSQNQLPCKPTDFWSSLDIYVKVIGGVVAMVAAILGLPIAFLQTRKTLAEIGKIELEVQKLRNEVVTEMHNESQGYQINVSNSRNTSVQIITDPRLATPLLLLLDFTIACIELILIRYTQNIFSLGNLDNFLVLIISCFLFIPLLREALRLKNVLRSDWSTNNNPKA